MNATIQTSPMSQTARAGNVAALALRLAHAENALHALTSGQIDAIVNADGKTYLMRPAQEQLRQNERRLQAVLESFVDVITVVDRSGTILSQNHAVTRVLGYESEELVGSVIFKLIHEADMLAVYSAFFNLVQELRTVRVPDHVLDERGHGLVSEMAFELIPSGNLAAATSLFEFEESAQRTEDMVVDRPFPAHEEPLDVADFLERVVVALDLPLQAAHVLEMAEGDLHALFFRGSLWA